MQKKKKKKIDQLFGYSKILLKNVLPKLSPQKKRLLCLYLVLKRLECEILNCGQQNVIQMVLPSLLNSQNSAKTYILKEWPFEGAIIISQIETFARRTQTQVMLECDGESIYSW